MCGIIGYCGPKPAAGLLLEGLKRLEYRGYDSAGICVQAEGGGPLSLYKRKGKIRDLIPLVPEELAGSCGIGHTRWATHGEVNDQNAHPHLDCSGRIAVVHNGIIENYLSLREKLASEGHRFASETDSEVIAHLIEKYYSGDLMEAVRRALALLKGTYGIVCLHRDHPDRLVGARQGSPLVVGIGHGESFLASDVTAIIGHTKQVVYLEDGELVCLTAEELRTTDLKDNEIQKKVESVSWELEQIEKGGFAHFMEKEIFEQPESIKRAMGGRLDLEEATAHLGGLNMSNRDLLNVERVRIVAAGTSWHAGLVGMYLLESVARIPCTVEIASELRYRNPVVEPHTLHFVVSQSGETADTLFAMRELKRKGATVLGICNVVGSTIPRESDGGVYIHSGPEIAVASTKAFTSQITVFYLFSLLLGRMRRPVSRRRQVLHPGPGQHPGQGRGDTGRQLLDPRGGPPLLPLPALPVPGPGHQLPGGHGGGPEAQGDLLHPRRRLQRRGAEARAHRPDRRGDALPVPGPGRRAAGQDPEQPQGSESSPGPGDRRLRPGGRRRCAASPTRSSRCRASTKPSTRS